MRAMKDSGVEWIGEIPAEWKIGRVKNIFIRKNEKAMLENPVVLSLARAGVHIRDISNNEGQMALSYYNYNPVDIGDLLLNPMDLYSGANCSISRVKGVISPAYINLKGKKDVDARYYDYYFKVQYWQMVFFSYGKGVSFENRWTLTNETLMNFKVLMLSYSEQQRIADYLDKKCVEIDAIISKQHSIIEKLQEYKLSLITETVTKGLIADAEMKDSGIEWIGKIPKHWDLCKLKHIGYLQNGISKGGEYFGYGYPFVSYGDVYKNISLPFTVEGLIDSTEEERFKYSVQEGDIFFTRTSETIEEVGFSAVCEKTIPEATFAGFLIRVRPYNDKITKEYAKYYFRSNHHRVYLVKEMNLVTRASLGQNLLKNMIVLLPPKEEQYKIADFLNRKCAGLEKIISDKLKLIIKLTEYKKSLIYEVVTGKKEV